MIVSRAKVLAAGLFSVVSVYGLLATDVMAEGGVGISISAPQQLKPEARNERSNTADRYRYDGYRAKSIDRSPENIQVNPLGDVDVNALGLLDQRDGGFGVNLWKGSHFSFIGELLVDDGLRGRSIVMRQLLRRLLLTGAIPPKGSRGLEFIVMRLKALMAMGDFNAALDLLRSIPKQNRSVLLRKLEMELHLVTDNSIDACAMVATEVTHRPDTFWQKALVYCELLVGKTSRAELGLSLLQEDEIGDATFLELAQGIINGQSKLPDVVDNFDALTLAMLKLAKLKVPLARARRYPAALIEVTADTGALKHLDAIEIAADLGVLADSELRKRYLAALPSSDEITDLKEGAITSLDRARLYLQAVGTKIPMARAEALERVMRSASGEGRLGGVARLFSPVIKSLAPENDLLWIAPLAFRISLLSGLWDSADSWLSLARRNAAFSPDASAIFQGLELLGILMQRDVSSFPKLAAMEKLTADQNILYISLFQALGGEVPEKFLETLVYKSEQLSPLPDPILWKKLTRWNYLYNGKGDATISKVSSLQSITKVISTTESGNKDLASPLGNNDLAATIDVTPEDPRLDRLGEQILVMLAAFGDQPLSALSPLVIAEVVRGLKRLGLQAEAHGLAMEAAINAGL